MTPLLNSTPHQDLRDWRELDKRVAKFKADQWERCHGFEPFWRAVKDACLVMLFWYLVIIGFGIYLNQKNDKEVNRLLNEWRNHKLLKK